MKRQNFKTPVMFSGIFVLALIAAVVTFYGPTKIKRPIVNEVSIPPMAGHWLRTERDREYIPAELEIKKPWKIKEQTTLSVLQLDEAKAAFNRQTETINIMYIWTDDERLRVISVTSFNKKTKQAAIIVIPLHTAVNSGDIVNLDNQYITLEELYKAKGRAEVNNFLQQKFELKISNFVHVNQSALRKLSNIVGVLKVNGGQTTMLEAFEHTAAGLRTDDRDVVRAVASEVLHPRMLLEVPRLLSIFTNDIRTNFTTAEMIQIFHFSRQMDLSNMHKTALPGYEHSAGNKKYLFVSGQTWKNLIYELTL